MRKGQERDEGSEEGWERGEGCVLAMLTTKDSCSPIRTGEAGGDSILQRLTTAGPRVRVYKKRRLPDTFSTQSNYHGQSTKTRWAGRCRGGSHPCEKLPQRR